MCSEVDNAIAIAWAPGGYLDYLGVQGDGLGQGAFNTGLITHYYDKLGATATPYAAKLCRDLNYNGYTDWNLPSLTEAFWMWYNLADSDHDGENLGPSDPNNLGNFEAAYYWQAMEYQETSPTITYGRRFSDGLVTSSSKFNISRVRAVRKF